MQIIVSYACHVHVSKRAKITFHPKINVVQSVLKVITLKD